MTSAARPANDPRADARTILGGGVTLGVVTAVGVAVFAFLSRPLNGGPETIVQSALVLVGGVIFAFFPAATVRPRDVDTVAWTALVGLLGALVFTVIDTAILRPIGVYHWTWDQIGGGSGFWYIPVWWMGSATLAWLGGWVFSIAARKGSVNLGKVAGLTVALGLALFVVLGVLGFAPWHPAVLALTFTLALVAHVPLASLVRRQ